MILMLGLDMFQWITIIIVAFLIGFSKTGINGVMMLAIPILASVFGGKNSTGIMLPILLVGDILAICYYHRNAKWKNVVAPLPWAFVGLAAGTVVGNYVSDGTFIKLIGMIVLLCLCILIYIERKGQDFEVPDAAWFYILVGILCGFTTMIGNAAGPIFSVYLLSQKIKKNEFMGISAWFFFIINFTKVPLQVFVWHNISIESLLITVIMIPIITLGAILGAFLLKKINEKFFRYLVIVMTAFAAIKLLI